MARLVPSSSAAAAPRRQDTGTNKKHFKAWKVMRVLLVTSGFCLIGLGWLSTSLQSRSSLNNNDDHGHMIGHLQAFTNMNNESSRRNLTERQRKATSKKTVEATDTTPVKKGTETEMEKREVPKGNEPMIEQVASWGDISDFFLNEISNKTKSNSSNDGHNASSPQETTAIDFSKVTDPIRMPLKPTPRYLGVLVDGGRHYFPLEWLKAMIDELYLLRYNFIHFRLTDDQAFNVKLDCHPELAFPAPRTAEDEEPDKENPVYTPADLRELVEYAKDRNIIVMPEINVPGHCGSWAGVPGIVVACPEFSCEKGYGVPLNVTSPKLMSVISNVIKEVREIFHTSPWLHLGGDEVHMSKQCFDEIHHNWPDYNAFELELKKVLKDLEISEDYVLRWETTGQKNVNARAGNVVHMWETQPRGVRVPFFVSQGLYMDSCGERAAQEFFQHTQDKLVTQNPIGIIVGTFELSTHWWLDRNVLGKMLVVAMGASKKERSLPWDSDTYKLLCKSLKYNDQVCNADAKPLLTTGTWLQKWKTHWVKWKAAACQRLTDSVEVRHVEPLRRTDTCSASRSFWDNFGKAPNSDLRNALTVDKKPLFSRAVPHSGVILELSSEYNHDFRKTIDMMATLGFNLLQLRLMDDSGFPVALESIPNAIMMVGRQREKSSLSLTGVDELREIVKYADRRGIKVMPEISVTSRAGGWYRTGLLAACPNVMCDRGMGIPLNINETPLLPVISNVVFELRSIFTSVFIHLGYDEREESMACFEESGDIPDIDLFEQRLMVILELQGIQPEHVLRWESNDETKAQHRAGGVTHYHLKTPPSSSKEPFFVSTDLGFETAGKDSKVDAWTIYRDARAHVKSSATGILSKYLMGNPDSWEKTNAIGMLIAAAMGASDLPYLDSKKFEHEYAKVCTEILGDSTACGQFGRTSGAMDWEAEQRRKLEKKTVCQTITKMSVKRLSKKEIL